MKKGIILFCFILLLIGVSNRRASAHTEFNDGNCDSLWEAGQLFMDQSKMDAALEVYLEYKRCKPEDDRVNGRIGFLYIELKMYHEADSFLGEVVKEYPTDFFCLYLWGNINRINGDYITSIQAYEIVEKEATDNLHWDFYFYYAWSVLNNGDVKKAELIFDHALTLAKESKEYNKLSFTLVSIFLEIDPGYSLEISNQAINECETFFGLMVMHSWRATCYLNLANFDKAKEEISYATKIADDSIALPHILNAYILLADSNAFEKIEAILTQVFSISKEAEYLLFASYINAYYGRVDNSCNLYKQYLETSKSKKSKDEYKYLCKGKIPENFSPTIFLPKFSVPDLLLDMDFLH